MHIYTFKDYKEDLERIINILENIKKDIHIIAPYKGGLPLGTAIANYFKAPLSILKMQRYDDNDDTASFIYNANISSSEELILVDDLWDTGETILKCVEFLHQQFPNNSIRVITIFGRSDHSGKHEYIRDHPCDWIVFEPWCS